MKSASAINFVKDIHSKMYLVIFLCISGFSHAQLPDFTLTVTPTAQTCLGNGYLSFTVANTQPGATMGYSVYLLPDTTTPVTIVNSSPVTNLVAGNYLVVATQTVGGESNTASANATIGDNVETLAFTPVQTRVRCGNDGAITVDVTSGTAATYEIMAGPVTVAPQASNVFNNLPVGQYQVRVFDECGDALVVTVQVTAIPTDIFIDAPAFAGGPLPDCNTITVEHFYATFFGYEIFFPLTFEYTVYPPGGGAPQIITQTVPTGSNIENEIYTDIPFYNGEEYSYDLAITDDCGNVFELNDNIVNQEFVFAILPQAPSCGNNFFTLDVENYVAPLTVTFLDSPAGFNPGDFNASHPVINGNADYGSEGNSVPLGVYTVEITDSCGNTNTQTIEITNEAEPVVLSATNAGTCLGQVAIAINGRVITSVIITAAPDEYGTVPDDVSEFIDPFVGFYIEGIPLGTYVFEVTDDCGEVYIIEETILPPTGGLAVAQLQRPGCADGDGSVRLSISGGGTITSAIITDAPADFNETLPYDASSNINATDGMFYMNSLPEGNYTFELSNFCGLTAVEDITITGYEVATNNVEVIPNCGSFDLLVEHISNGTYSQSFWLQEYNEGTGTWGHPATGVPYTEGTQPLNTNSIFINNNQINYTFAYTGQFRVIKVFFNFSNGSAASNRCVQEIYNFTFDGQPNIESAFSFPCANGTAEVLISANGVEPLVYAITSKDGEPFTLDNGTSSLFSGLEPANYNFQVTDDCGNIRNIQLDINELDPMEIEADGFCDGEESVLFVQEFSFLTYEWYNVNDPSTILSTDNSLDFPSFNPGTQAGTYAVSISSNNAGSCIDQVLEYEILPNAQPNAGEDAVAALCNDGEDIDLTAYLSPAHDAGGVWQDTDGSGALTGNTLATDGLAEGIYSFTYTVTGLCDNTDEAIVTLEVKNRPAAPQPDPVAALCEGEALQLTAGNVVGATYQWMGPNNFTSAEQNPLINTASVAATGTYTVTVTVNGCASPGAQVAVTVNAVPAFSIDGTTSICEGQGTELTVNPENFNGTAVDYTWYYEGDEIAGLTEAGIEAFETGEYEVVVNNNGCETREQVTVTENNAAFVVEAEGGCRDYNYIIAVANADELPGAVFEWTGPSGFTFTGSEADITDLPTGDYTVTVTNAEGCTAQDTLTIDNTSCFIPRGLSPNNDGLNDSFDLSNLDVREIKIFNRYGLEVYEQQNYIDEWYGQSDKGELPAGTYFYVLTLSEGKNVTGWVYLQREVSR